MLSPKALIEAVTRREEIADELSRLASVAAGIQLRYQAHFSLHQAACLNGDHSEIAQRRDELHTIMDALLDNGEAIQRLAKEAERLS
jgi:hypothetical protein